MAKVKGIDDLLAEQAVRKAVACYSRGADRCDIGILKSAFHPDAEVKYGSYDGPYEEFCNNVVAGHLAMNYTTHTIINQYFDIDAASATGTGEIYVLAFLSMSQAGDVMAVDDYKDRSSDGGHEYIVAGRYVDQYQCRGGDWRISLRQYILDWSRTSEYTGHDPNKLFESLSYRGTQNRDDVSYSILGD
ncbi:MAG: nuclear transport factor 2 family protein [Pseudomonadales bacterium]